MSDRNLHAALTVSNFLASVFARVVEKADPEKTLETRHPPPSAWDRCGHSARSGKNRCWTPDTSQLALVRNARRINFRWEAGIADGTRLGQTILNHAEHERMHGFLDDQRPG